MAATTKLDRRSVLKGIAGEKLPIYGRGDNIRDWLFVDDHVSALARVLDQGVPGETYNIGGQCELSNLEVVNTVCQILDKLKPASKPYADQIEYVDDRPGHDFRYAMNIEKISAELNWQPAENFATGIEKTVRWYLDNPKWWQAILDGSYRLERLGNA